MLFKSCIRLLKLLVYIVMEKMFVLWKICLFCTQYVLCYMIFVSCYRKYSLSVMENMFVLYFVMENVFVLYTICFVLHDFCFML